MDALVAALLDAVFRKRREECERRGDPKHVIETLGKAKEEVEVARLADKLRAQAAGSAKDADPSALFQRAALQDVALHVLAAELDWLLNKGQ